MTLTLPGRRLRVVTATVYLPSVVAFGDGDGGGRSL